MSAKKLLKNIGAVLFWLIVWQVCAVIANKDLLIAIPTPVAVVKAFISFCTSGEFWYSATLSVVRICLGFFSAVLVGTLCAVISSYSSFFKTLTLPLLQIIRAIPVASFIILVFLWLPKGRIPTFISFLTVFPIIWANVESGINATDRSLLEMAQVFGMKRNATLKEIILPAIKPYFTSAVSTGLGFGWKSGVAAEIICRTQNSLGNMLWVGKSAVEYEEVFALSAVIIVLSVIFEKGISLILRRAKV